MDLNMNNLVFIVLLFILQTFYGGKISELRKNLLNDHR